MKSSSLVCRILRALLPGVLAVSALHAQVDTGRVEGTVKDPSGAVISGATVTLTNDATHVAQNVSSSATGTYVFGAVKPGVYTLTTKSAGFQTSTITGIEAHVQQNLTTDVTLTAGNLSTEVTVTSAAPLLQSEDASVGQTITGENVNNLPLSGRNWVSLAQLSAGVTTTAGGTPGSALFVTNGVNFWQNDIRLNGINNNEEVYGGTQFNTNAVFTPPPDAIQEFKLQTGDFSAEFGHSTGAVLNAVIKSGTNRLHGNVWEYIRNTAFNANDYFANNYADPSLRQRPAYHQNQFGGTIGGPVLIPKVYNGRDKTFFFFDYQGTRIVTPAHSTSYVPTTGMHNSNFTDFRDYFALASGTKSDALGRRFPLAAFFDPATTRMVQPGAIDPISQLRNTSGAAVPVRDPFYNGGSIAGITDFTQRQQFLNQLPASRLDPNALKLLALYPSPTPGRAGRDNYDIFPKFSQTINQYDIRIDQNFSERDILFGVLDVSRTNNTAPAYLPGIANGQNYGAGYTQAPRYGVALGYTHVFTPTLTNEIHAGWNHSIQRIIPFEADTLGIPEQFGISGVPQSPGNGGLPQINISGFTGLGVAGYTPTLTTITVLEIPDNVTKTYRSHTFKMGVQVDDIRAGIIQPPNGKGSFTFNGQYADIPNASAGYSGVADLLLTPTASTVGGPDNVGGTSSYSTSNYAQTKTQRYYIGAYFQDDWKATPNLTLNLGLRWDHYTPNAEVRGRQANFVQTDGNGPSGTLYMSPAGCAVPRSANFDVLLAANNITLNCNASNATGLAQNLNFAPRVGFAFRPTSNIAMRGGYGIAYGALDNIGFGGTLGTNYPFNYSITFNAINDSVTPLTIPSGQTATLENALSGQNLQDPTVVSGAGVGLSGREYLYKTAYTQTFNFTVQDQFTSHDSIQIAYVGTLGRHLDSTGSHNSVSAILPVGTNFLDPKVQGHVPFPVFSRNSAFQRTDANSSYNSLQATYQHQLSIGLTVLANYTYAKCLTDQRTISGNSPGFRAPWLPGFGISGDYGLCDSDTAHVTHVSGTYYLPFGRGKQLLGNDSRLLDVFVGGWITNYIVTHQSGQPFTVNCPRKTTADFGCFANQVPGQNLYDPAHSPRQWLNPKAFAQPAVATQIGQTDFSPLGGAPNQARGPGFSNVDFSIFKEFTPRESFKIQFRAEAFNLFNSHSFGQPTNLDFTNSQNFSQITSSRNNARLGQFALKLSF